MKEVQVIPSYNLFEIDNQVTLKWYKYFVPLVKQCLTPDLLKPEYRLINIENSMFGHCYVASEALYHFFEKKELQPFWGKDFNGITHWWLMNDIQHVRLDPTCDQYYSQELTPPYYDGHPAAFLTNEPSKRCETVIRRLITLIHDNVPKDIFAEFLKWRN